MTEDAIDYFEGERKDQAKAERKAHNDTQAEINDLRAIMNTKPGRRHMWTLLAKCGVYQQSFTGDMATTSFNEGKRQIGLRYLALLTEHCLENYQRMEAEQRRAALKAKPEKED